MEKNGWKEREYFFIFFYNSRYFIRRFLVRVSRISTDILNICSGFVFTFFL
jgi:hypothetical protein